MPGNPILLCAPTDALRQHLEQSLAARGYRTYAVRTPADAVAVLRDARYDLVVAEGLAVTGAIGGMRTAAPIPTPILVVARAGDVEARIAFLEAGADDVVAEDFAASELDARIEALLIRSGRLRPDTEDRAVSAANLVTFFSPKGGVGTTTLAVNTAVLLAMGADAATPVRPRVLLVDMDLQFGQVATHLNINPRFDLGGLAGDEPALNDPELAASYLSEHSSGLSVLAAPVSPEADFRVTLDHVERIIGLLRPRFDLILVDSGSRLDQRTLWLLEQADTHVFVIFPEIAALRASSLLLGFLAETAALRARTLFVVNHIFPKELLKTRDIENLLRTRPAAEIPYTEVEMIRAVNEGIPVVMSRRTSPAAMAIERLARAVMGVEVAQPARQKKPERRLLPFGR